MKLIDDWKATLAKSYTMWLAYIMAGCGAAVEAINLAGPTVIPQVMADDVKVWLLRAVFACTVLLIPARITKQAGLNKDQLG